jgi:hypothetical protein
MSGHRCEAVDMVPTADDAIAMRCARSGVRTMGTVDIGRQRVRYVCWVHRMGWCDWFPFSDTANAARDIS